MEFVKAEFVRKRMVEGKMKYDSCVFLDDDRSNVDQVKLGQVCRYVYVPDTGIDDQIMAALER